MKPEDVTLEQALDLIKARNDGELPKAGEAESTKKSKGKRKAAPKAEAKAGVKKAPVKKAEEKAAKAVPAIKAAAKTIVRKK